MKKTFCTILGLLVLACPASAQGKVDYLREVKPILVQHCFECHAAKMQKGKVRVDTAAFMLKADIIVPGKSANSLLIHAVQGSNDVTRMPYKRPPLTEKQIGILTAWIDQGAAAPADEKADDGGRGHWAFQTPVRPALPQVKNAAWVRNPIDAFILARLEKESLKPSPEADRFTLVRRVYLDLIGLPPSPEEVDAFLQDSRPDAYEHLVDRLLQSPHYGERWGRHWLDLARYADTHGFTIDAPREIWKYRDWVIESLNKDLPFDQFVIEQMAGDMLPKASVEQKIATGFHRNTLINQEGGIDVEQFRVEAVVDRVSTTGTVFLGLTIGCARCHDHKYDPITQKEFYQLFAFLNNQTEPTLSLATPDVVAKREKISTQIQKLEEDLNDQLRDYVKNLPEEEKKNLKRDVEVILNLGPEQRTEKQKQTLAAYFRPKDKNFAVSFDKIAALKKEEPKFPTTMVLQEMPKPRETTVHIQGDFTRKGEKVKSGVPAVLHPLAKSKTGANRLDFAQWLVDRKNPLIGRVTMNRLWQQYFGKGLVETENDFGTQGALPTHADLLDWLATEFVGAQSAELSRPWSLKAMHKLIVTSATYRQSSKMRADLAETDPNNRLLARQNRLRLDAEVIRDNALTVSGLLNRQLGGPPVFPPQPTGIYQFTQVPRTWKTSTGPDRYRRGLYTFLQRSAPYPALIVFDAPDGTNSCTRRIRSNTPLQALTLLNDQAFLELAQGLAQRVLKETSKEKRIHLAFRLCMARPASAREAKRLEDFVDKQLKEFQASPKEALAFLQEKEIRPSLAERAAWTSLSRVLMNLDEFITRE